MLIFARDAFPTHRVDIEVLFGRELIGRGHAIDFVMQAESADVAHGRQNWHGRTVWVGAAFSTSGAVGRLWHFVRGFLHDVRSLGLLTANRYSAVQVRDKFVIAAFALVVAKYRGLKFFYWLSFPVPEADILRGTAGEGRAPGLIRLRGRFFAWLLYRWILPHSDHIFVQSEPMKRNLVAKGIAPERMTPVPMGVDPDDVIPVNRWVHSAGEIRLGYIGTLGVERKIEILVDMLAMLRRDNVPATLLLVGDGEVPQDRQLLMTRARNAGVEQHMTITGFLPRSEALKQIRTVDVALSPIFASPILNVGSPTKLIEYLAMRLPVVANDQYEQALILDECRAGVCVPWSARHFARGVRWILRRTPAELEVMTARGMDWVVRNRTYRTIADGVEREYLKQLAVIRPGSRQTRKV